MVGVNVRHWFVALTWTIAGAAMTGCAKSSAIPLSASIMQIDVSASPVYGRTGVQQVALTKAAEATVAAGYDKFHVIRNGAWNEQTLHGSTTVEPRGQISAKVDTIRRPEAHMIIKMFKRDDPAASDAVDAHAVLKAKAPSNPASQPGAPVVAQAR
jgi:hypothetical protein